MRQGASSPGRRSPRSPATSPTPAARRLEGFLLVLVHAQAPNSVVAKREELEHLPLNLDATALAPPSRPEPGQDMLAEVGQLLQLEVKVVPGAYPLSGCPANTVDAVVGRTVGSRGCGELNLRVKARETRLHIAS